MPSFIEQWLQGNQVFDAQQRHTIALLVEQAAIRNANQSTISDLIRRHYVDDATTASRLQALGATATADLLREDLPTKPKSRSGAMGEIIATELRNSELDGECQSRDSDGRTVAKARCEATILLG